MEKKEEEEGNNFIYLKDELIKKRKLDFFIDSKYMINLCLETEKIVIEFDYNGCSFHLYSEMKKEYTEKKMKLLREISKSKYIGIDKMKNLIIYV